MVFKSGGAQESIRNTLTRQGLIPGYNTAGTLLRKYFLYSFIKNHLYYG